MACFYTACHLKMYLIKKKKRVYLKREKEEEEGEDEEKEDKKADGGKRGHNVTEIACDMKTKNIYHLVSYRKSWPTSALKY